MPVIRGRPRALEEPPAREKNAGPNGAQKRGSSGPDTSFFAWISPGGAAFSLRKGGAGGYSRLPCLSPSPSPSTPPADGEKSSKEDVRERACPLPAGEHVSGLPGGDLP